MRGGDPMPPELAKGKWLMPWDSKSLVQQIELGEDSRVEFEEAGFAGNRVRAPRRETVSSAGGPLAGAQVIALYPNKTWMEGTTDTFGRVTFGFHSELPITVFCAAPGHGGHVERDWRPPKPLSVQLDPLPRGGSVVFTEQAGRLPGLTGRLNPTLDNLDRMYLYAANVAIEAGRQQPVHFKLNQPLRLTDVNGFECIVRFIEMIGKSALLEYEPPPAPGVPLS